MRDDLGDLSGLDGVVEREVEVMGQFDFRPLYART